MKKKSALGIETGGAATPRPARVKNADAAVKKTDTALQPIMLVGIPEIPKG